MITPREISAYLQVIESREKDQWSWISPEAGGYWQIKYSGTRPVCLLYMALDGPSLCVQTELGDFRVRPDCQQAVWYLLLRLNDDLPVAKFGLSENGKITLMAEAVASHINLSTLEELLRLLVAVVEQYRREIELLAGESTLAGLLEPASAKAEPAISLNVLKRESNQL